ncbi:glycosyltransferase family 2 protein [Tropicimonas sp. S265A]|uniref:glycosyltransferase family 2 protein n=1 Tax=Tropicimonas sp. S265A TaxID=3415134 RepID=UPI003C79EFB9
MTLPRMRILMAAYQGAPYLQAQLDSFVAQSHPDWALWVSDDGSTDGTRDILAAFAAAHPEREIRLFTGPEKGLAANFLSLMTRPEMPQDGACVALSDQDDVWHPDRLARAARALQPPAGARPTLYAAQTVVTDATLRPLRKQARTRKAGGFRNALVQNVMAGNTMALNPEALALVRSTCPRQPVPFHDWWLYLLVTGAGGAVIQDQQATVFYRQHARNALGAHGSAAARLRRLGLVLDGTYLRWSYANLSALQEVAAVLTPAHRALIAPLTGSLGQRGLRRVQALQRAGAHRDSRAGQMALTALALAGRA